MGQMVLGLGRKRRKREGRVSCGGAEDDREWVGSA